MKSRPLLQCRDLSEFYQNCAERLDQALTVLLDQEYPASYDTSIQPVSTLRTAHAVQLAAMNSQIESVTINGTQYLAKYMLVEQPETFEDYVVHDPAQEAHHPLPPPARDRSG